MADAYQFTLTVTKHTDAVVPGQRAVTILYNAHFTENQLAALVHIFEHAGQDPVPPAYATERVAAPQFDPAPQPSPADRVTQQAQARAQAKAANYTGDSCSSCGSMAMKVSGHCQVCEACGTTTGCS